MTIIRQSLVSCLTDSCIYGIGVVVVVVAVVVIVSDIFAEDVLVVRIIRKP